MTAFEVDTARRLLSYLENNPAKTIGVDVDFKSLSAETKKRIKRELFDFEKGVCPIDGRPFPRQLDHDHKTGRIRGLVCKRCNTKLLGAIETSEREQASGLWEYERQLENDGTPDHEIRSLVRQRYLDTRNAEQISSGLLGEVGSDGGSARC